MLSKSDLEFDLNLNILYKIGFKENWFNGENIFISMRKASSRVFTINAPKEIDKNQLKFMDINMETVDLDFQNVNNYVASFLIHFLIHNSDSINDARCILFINSINVIEVSKTDHGLFPVSQESFFVNGSEIFQFDFLEFCREFSEIFGSHCEEMIIKCLFKYQGIFNQILSKNNIFLLKNMGAFVTGKTIEETWFNCYIFDYACQTQMKLGKCIHSENVIVPDIETQKNVLKQFKGSISSTLMLNNPNDNVEWLPGQLEFEALMRDFEYNESSSGYDFKIKSIWK